MRIELPHIKLPHFSLSGSFSLNPPSVPHLSVDWYAKGALFTKPTIFAGNGFRGVGVGEAGREYALPLNEKSLTPLAVMLNKLTATGENGLADMLAARFDNAVDRLAARIERIEANFYVDGEKLASTTASHNDSNGGMRALLAERGLALK